MSRKSQHEYIQALRKKPIRPEQHGHISTYTNYGCRCEKCTNANRVYMKAYRARMRNALN